MANRVTTRTTRLMMIAGSTFITALLSAQVASADRLPDKDIKQLLERIHDERDRFEINSMGS